MTRGQLLECGVSPSAIARSVRSGTLHRLYRGVYATVAPELLSEDALLLSALFAAGPVSYTHLTLPTTERV